MTGEEERNLAEFSAWRKKTLEGGGAAKWARKGGRERRGRREKNGG